MSGRAQLVGCRWDYETMRLVLFYFISLFFSREYWNDPTDLLVVSFRATYHIHLAYWYSVARRFFFCARAVSSLVVFSKHIFLILWKEKPWSTVFGPGTFPIGREFLVGEKTILGRPTVVRARSCPIYRS